LILEEEKKKVKRKKKIRLLRYFHPNFLLDVID